MNGVNLLAKAKRNQFKGPTASSTGITWDSCRPEITSSSDKEIFFPHNNSFVAFPTLNLRVECRVSLEVKVHANSAMLVYASGSKVESDFLALEIVVGAVQVRLSVDVSVLRFMFFCSRFYGADFKLISDARDKQGFIMLHVPAFKNIYFVLLDLISKNKFVFLDADRHLCLS